MKTTKKPLPAGQDDKGWAGKNSAERAALQKIPLLLYHERKEHSMRILDFLGHGRENATRADVLAAQLETTPRGLRRQIMQAREQGETILYSPGGHGGYFLPSDDPETAQQEMSAFYHVQAARCKHGLAAIAPVARKLGIPIGQMNFENEES